MWPLKTRLAGHSDQHGGFTIEGVLNASDYVYYGWDNLDSITVTISDPYSDAVSENAKIQLFPCERLTLVLSLEERHLTNRRDSPCRSDESKMSNFMRKFSFFLKKIPEMRFRT